MVGCTLLLALDRFTNFLNFLSLDSNLVKISVQIYGPLILILFDLNCARNTGISCDTAKLSVNLTDYSRFSSVILSRFIVLYSLSPSYNGDFFLSA